MILKTNIHQQNFSFQQIFPSRSLSVNILPVSLHPNKKPPQFETHPTPPCLGRESNTHHRTPITRILFFLFCKGRPARAVKSGSSADASLLVGCRWITFDTAVPNARMLYRKEVFCWFLLNLCAFVSSCSINLLSLKLSLIILFRFERFLVRRTITNIQL